MNIALCWSCIIARTFSAIVASPTWSAYDVLVVFRMRPPSAKRCVMMCGCLTPESSVWMWKTRPLWRTLLLNPRSGDGDFTDSFVRWGRAATGVAAVCSCRGRFAEALSVAVMATESRPWAQRTTGRAARKPPSRPRPISGGRQRRRRSAASAGGAVGRQRRRRGQRRGRQRSKASAFGAFMAQSTSLRVSSPSHRRKAWRSLAAAAWANDFRSARAEAAGLGSAA